MMTFLVVDANTLPFGDQTFDLALTYGALHHLVNPNSVCREIQRILRDEGIHLGSENNKSVFRGIFDVLMKVSPLWFEAAGTEPLISASMISEWIRGLPVQTRFRTSVFMPPHLLNLLPRRLARLILDITDRIFGLLPILGEQGGLIVFELRKIHSARNFQEDRPSLGV